MTDTRAAPADPIAAVTHPDPYPVSAMKAAISGIAAALSVTGCALPPAGVPPAAPLAVAAAATAPAPVERRDDWRAYGADRANTKYSPLAQVDRDNFAALEVAWRWRSADAAALEADPGLRTGTFETTPLMVDGVLYASTSLSQVAAIDARNGATLWVHDPKSHGGQTPPNLGYVHRGVAYWADRADRRILIGTGDGASWSGAAFDPDTGRLYVPSITMPFEVALSPSPFSPAPLVGQHTPLLGPRRLMITKPPYGRITSIELTTGDHRFAVPVGEGPRRHPALVALDLPPLGWPMRIHVLLTKTLLIAGQEGYRRNE